VFAFVIVTSRCVVFGVPLAARYAVGCHPFLARLPRYFFGAVTNTHSWLGIVIVLTTTYCYMNIALRQEPSPAPSVVVPKPAENEEARLLDDADKVESGKEDRS